MIKPDPEYRRSLFDKLGPEAADIFSIANWMIVPTVAGIGIAVTLAARANYTMPFIVASGLLGGVITGGGAGLFILGMSRGAGAIFESFVHPNTGYQRDYSREDALLARGDVEGALASFAQIAAEEPGNLDVRLRAAEVCRKNSSFEKAASLYREVQSKAERNRDDVHASLRLIDLYIAWPENEGKAMREYRRLIDRYPGTEIERRSREALATLKRERFPEAG